MMTFESMIKRLPLDVIFSRNIRDAVDSVDKCIDGGSCETKCPYNLKIRTRIKEGAALFRKLELAE